MYRTAQFLGDTPSLLAAQRCLPAAHRAHVKTDNPGMRLWEEVDGHQARVVVQAGGTIGYDLFYVSAFASRTAPNLSAP